MKKKTRDYEGAYEEAENMGYPRPDSDYLRCNQCGRPSYYDYGDEAYHHAVRAHEGCFLIGAECRPDDPNHPLVVAEGDGR